MKVLPTKWRDIKIRRAEPAVYLRYFKQLTANSHISSVDHFIIEKQHTCCEIFYEQLDNELWLLVIENSGKSDNRYILKPKRSTNYYSINVFSTSTRMGYREQDRIKWGSEHIWFMTPGDELELFQENEAVIRCVRIIFSKDYLARLINDNNNILMDKLTKAPSLHRGASKAELLLQFRVINVLKYERGKYHYKASLLSNVFEHLAFFLDCR